MGEINTHGMICNFGRHKGVPYTQVPVSYLKWMINADARESEIAKAELDRRGTVTPEIEISGHAIDGASLRCRKIWHEHREKGEGLHAWLIKVAQGALKNGKKDDKGRYHFMDMKFVFTQDGIWPVLKTVMREKG
jgi:hypothetical protein